MAGTQVMKGAGEPEDPQENPQRTEASPGQHAQAPQPAAHAEAPPHAQARHPQAPHPQAPQHAHAEHDHAHAPHAPVPQAGQAGHAEPADAPPLKSSGFGKWLAIAGGLLVLAVIGGVVAGLLLWGPYTRKLVIESARERGVEIDPESVSVPFSLKSAKLTNTKFRLIGVSGLEGEIKDLEVELDNRHPSSFALKGVVVRLTGSAPTLALELSEWTAAHPRLYGHPMRASEVNLTWKPDAAAEPWLEVTGGTVAPITGGAAFSVENAKVSGFETGKIGASWTGESALVDMAFGAEPGAAAPVKLTVVHTPGKASGAYTPYAEIRVAKLPLDRFAGPLRMPIDTKGVTLELTARLNFESNLMGGPVNGNVDSTLVGYSPPKPPELASYDFGDRTKVSTKFNLDSERKLLTLTETEVGAGSFKLKGSGEVRRLPDHARILLKLIANLPCAELAAAEVEARLKPLGQLGKLAGNLAKQVLKGSVGVTLLVDADSRKLSEAKVGKIIGIGCGLKPLTFPNLADFPELGEIPLPPGLPKDLPKSLPTALPSGFPTAMPPASSLPPMPSAFPAPGQGFPFPFGKKEEPPAD